MTTVRGVELRTAANTIVHVEQLMWAKAVWVFQPDTSLCGTKNSTVRGCCGLSRAARAWRRVPGAGTAFYHSTRPGTPRAAARQVAIGYARRLRASRAFCARFLGRGKGVCSLARVRRGLCFR